jgi:hypothetical protein
MDPITGIELAASVVQLGGFVISSVQTLSKIRPEEWLPRFADYQQGYILT